MIRVVFVIAFSVVTGSIHAQDNIDSLLNVYKNHSKDTLGVQALNDLEIALEYSDFEKARKYVKMAYKLSKELKFERGITSSLTNFCWLYKNNRKPDSALIFQKQLLAIAKQNNNYDLTGTAYMMEGSIQHSKHEFEKAVAAYKKAIAMHFKSKNDEANAMIFNNLGNVWSDQGNFDSAVVYYNKSIEIRTRIKQMVKVLDVKTNLAVCYVRLGKFDEAVETFLYNAHEFEKMNKELNAAQCYANVAVVFSMTKNNEKGLEYSLKSLNYYKKTNDLKQIGLLTNNVGVAYEALGKNTEAMKYYNEAKRTYEKANDPLGLATSLNNIGVIYQKTNRYKKALDCFQKALKYKLALNEINTLPLTYYHVGSAFADLKNYDSALVYLGKSEKLAEELNYLPDLKNCYNVYCNVYEAMGDDKKALFYFKKFHQYSDSLIDSEKAKRITELQAEFEANKRELENKRLVIKHQKEQIARIEAEQTSERKSRWLYFSIGIAALIVTSSIIFFQIRRRKAREKFNAILINQKEEGIKAVFSATEEERKRIAKDLHDGVGQQMTGLKMAWQKLSAEFQANAPEKVEKLTQLTDLLDKTSTDVRTISHQMMPKVLMEIGLVPALEDMFNKSLTHTGINHEFAAMNVTTRLDERIEISVYRICQELTNNVIKHSAATRFSVQVMKQKEQLVLIAEDNGKGMPEGNASEGIGMMSMRSRLETIKGKISFQPGPDRGTVVTVRIPL